jgi:phosphoribosylamine--glycine ligase
MWESLQTAAHTPSLALDRWDLPLQSAGFPALVKKAKSLAVDLVIVGPDNPLADGVVDAFRAAGVPAFGPTAAAARIESSKIFAKEIMHEAGVPTARFRIFDSEAALWEFLGSGAFGPGGHSGFVLKADGLALGKGVIVVGEDWNSTAAGREAVKKNVRDLFQISKRLLVEERLCGEEISWLGIADGTHVSLFEPARDYKRVGEGDTGPNTGGMGAISPVPGYGRAGENPALYARVEREIFAPVIACMARRGTPFTGVLYAGLMVNPVSGAIHVLEFNARFGDPEAQVLLQRLDPGSAGGDIVEWCLAAARGTLDRMPRRIPMVPEAAAVIVGAARGYPENPETGVVISRSGPMGDADRIVFAGVKRQGADLVTSGGRVCGAIGTGRSVGRAVERALHALHSLRFSGMQFRPDIGRTPVPVAVLASGRGSNFRSIAESIRAGRLSASIRVLVTDQPDAGAIAVAREFGIPVRVVPKPPAQAQGREAQAKNREIHDAAILEALAPFAPRFLVLAGYMRILSPSLIRRLDTGLGYSRIVNIHPSLLPAFRGLEAYRQAFESGATETGVTVHLVNEALDGGPICAQERVSIAGCKDVAELERRGLAVEHRLYPEALRWILQEEFEVRGTHARPL